MKYGAAATITIQRLGCLQTMDGLVLTMRDAGRDGWLLTLCSKGRGARVINSSTLQLSSEQAAILRKTSCITTSK